MLPGNPVGILLNVYVVHVFPFKSNTHNYTHEQKSPWQVVFWHRGITVKIISLNPTEHT